jgi:hypothetical protein
MNTLLVALIAWHTIGAQSVRGVVRADERGVNLAGVVLVLRDSLSTDLAQAVSKESGEFVLRAPSTGSYLLRARRIGF